MSVSRPTFLAILQVAAASWSGQSPAAQRLSREANELVAILSSSIRTASKRLESG